MPSPMKKRVESQITILGIVKESLPSMRTTIPNRYQNKKATKGGMRIIEAICSSVCVSKFIKSGQDLSSV